MRFVGFDDIKISGVQRYPLSNHLNWLKKGEPSGYKSEFSIIDTNSLSISYENALSKIDATDTLVAVANVP